MKFKINAEQKAILKRCAQAEAASGGERISLGNISLEPGIRMNIEDETFAEPNMNIWLVSSNSNWDDTDLYDFATWADFCAGVELTEAGGGEVDFYIRKVKYSPDDDTLFGNIQIVIIEGKMSHVDITSGVRWTKEGGFL